MRMILCLVVFGISWLPPLARAETVNVLSAISTSHSDDSKPITCLLDTACRGMWSPGSVDAGANEGVYVQFETPARVDAIELISNSKGGMIPYVLTVNGAQITGEGKPSPSTSSRENAYAARYALAGTEVKSIFFRLTARKGGWKHFSLYAIRFYSKNKLIKLNNPILVPATVTATSQLEPIVAYQPANLFDSRYDFAWSTNGKNTKGPGQSIEVKFNNPQNIGGMLIWDGYQRSRTHYSANGRVTRMTMHAGKKKQDLVVMDKFGMQQIRLKEPLKQVSSLRLTIDAIAPGKKYKDVLISELRFLDDQGRIVQPQVTGLRPAANKLTEKLAGKSFSSLICSASIAPGNYQRSLRLRKDGSFVIYANSYNSQGKKTDRVLEGNWDLRGTSVRIFGKRYTETILESDYSQTKTRVPASIFQSDLKIARFTQLKPSEQKQLVNLIWTRIIGKAPVSSSKRIKILGTDNQVLASGEDKKTVLASMIAALKWSNPWTFRSPILADAMLPSDDIGSCGSSL